MDYEKLYKETLEMAMTLYKESNEAGKKYLEKIFPQLKEPEGEKIRKKIVKAFEDYKDRHLCQNNKYPRWEGIEVGQILLWLRGQKGVETIQWNGDNLKEVIEFTGSGNYYRNWFNNWEEYEEYVRTHDNIFKIFLEDGSQFEVPVGAWLVKAPDGRTIPSKFTFVPRNSKWEDKDRLYLEDALWCVDQARKQAKDENDMGNCWAAEMWLKSLTFPGKKRLWTEEDEKMRALLLAILDVEHPQGVFSLSEDMMETFHCNVMSVKAIKKWLQDLT